MSFRWLATFALASAFLGLAVAQPPRKEEEEDSKAKPAKPIDIESFQPPKGEPKIKMPEGPGVAPGAATLVVGVRSLPENLSPSRARTDPDRWSLDLLFDGLLRPVNYEAGTAFAPNLATMTADPGGRAFQLDPKAKWSDGTPVVANDILATLEKLRANAGGAGLGEATSDAPRRFRIALPTPSPDPATLFTFKILPASKPDDDAFARAPIGSGPFVFSGSATYGGRAYAVFPLHPNASQRSQPLFLREVRFLASPDPLTDLRRGLADVVLEERTIALFGGAAPTNRLDSGLGTNARVVTVQSRRIYYLSANPIKMALGGDAGQHMRRAIAFGIRREAILDEVWRGVKDSPFHKALTGPFPSNSWPCDTGSTALDDETLARAELREAKMPAEKLSVIYEEDEPAAALACSRIAVQLTGLGLPCEAKPLPYAEFTQVLAAKQYDLAYRHFDFRDDWFDPAELFAPRNGGSHPKLDGAISRAATRTEFTTLRDARRRLHRDFRESMPFIPLWCPDVHLVLRRGIDPPPGDRIDPLAPLADIDRWRVSR